MEFKEKLKKLRREKRISQQVLADAIFVSRSAVAKWECGLGLPSEESYLALSRFFGVECEYLKSDELTDVQIKKNKRKRIIAITVNSVCLVLIFAISALLLASALLDNYGLTPALAAGVYADDPYFENDNLIIYYYNIMDVKLPSGESRSVLGGFRPVRKIPFGWAVFEEDYEYRKLYLEGNCIGKIYSMYADSCYYNIVRILIAGEGLPLDLIIFHYVTIGDKDYDVELSSYFVTDRKPEDSIKIGEFTVEIGEEIFK